MINYTKKPLETTGSFYQKDSKGYLINTTSFKNIPEDILPAIEDIVTSYRNIFDDNIHGVYLRGSLAEGKFRRNYSDIDAFAVLKNPTTKSKILELRRIARKLEKCYSFCPKFDLEVNSIDDLLYDVNYTFLKVVIKVQSLFLYGNNLQTKLPRYKPTSSIISTVFNLEEIFELGKSKIESAKESNKVQIWCAWIMRTITRASFELIIDREQEFTRDLFLCYKVFSKYYPEKSSLAYRVLELAINPTADKSEAIEIAKCFSSWIVVEAQRVYRDKADRLKRPINPKYL